MARPQPPEDQLDLLPRDQTGKGVYELDIIGEIGWDVTAKSIRAELKEAGEVEEIHVRLHSQGGSVFDGFFIYSVLDRHPATVSVEVSGLAASAGAWIPMAASPGKLTATSVSFLMVHNARSGVYGEAEDMEKQSRLLRRLDESMAGLFAKRSGRDSAEWREMMTATTWMTAEEAKALGIVDEVVEGPDVSNIVRPLDLSKIHAQIPDEVARRFAIGRGAAKDQDFLGELLAGLSREVPERDVPVIPAGYLEQVVAALNRNGDSANG